MKIKFTWTKDMSVNNDLLDVQHQNLFQKINELLDAIIEQKTEHVVDDMVHFFKEYMDQHFTYEEQYLEENGYPDVASHKEKHDVFVAKYHELKEKLTEDGKSNDALVLEIENFMGSWLTQHILVEDKRYAEYFQRGKNIMQ